MNADSPYAIRAQHTQAPHSCGMTRRQWLARTAGLAGLWALGDWQGLLRAGDIPAAAHTPNLAESAPSLPVAIQRCESYDLALVRARLDAALDGIGGLGRLVRGKTVTMKVNMTGPARDVDGLPASRTYHVHPNVVAAACAALDRAGARRIAIVEAWYSNEPVESLLANAGWDIAALQAGCGHKVVFENTRNRGHWDRYSERKVPWGGYLFPAFELNRWYDQTDVFVSLGKMKDHEVAGLTLSVKNLFGITPTALYGDDAPNEQSVQARVQALHMNQRALPKGVPAQLGQAPPNSAGSRVPRIIADLHGARPVDLAIIDGVDTQKGGEGFWNDGIRPVQPKLLFAGRNAVCTDAVCATAMGYNPMADHGHFPFPGENHLKWAAEAGVGTNDPARIEVVGLSLKQARYPFRVRPGASAKPA
jgi:uncharacterized protein (DUF362 family)